MSALPTKWAVCDASWGAGKKHLYCPEHESLQFYKTEREAYTAADSYIQEGSKMVMVLEIKQLLVAQSIPYEQIA